MKSLQGLFIFMIGKRFALEQVSCKLKERWTSMMINIVNKPQFAFLKAELTTMGFLFCIRDIVRSMVMCYHINRLEQACGTSMECSVGSILLCCVGRDIYIGSASYQHHARTFQELDLASNSNPNLRFKSLPKVIHLVLYCTLYHTATLDHAPPRLSSTDNKPPTSSSHW